MLAGYFSLSCYNNINRSMQTKTMRRNLNLLTVCCIPGFKTYQPFDRHFLLIVLVSRQSYQYTIYIATNSIAVKLLQIQRLPIEILVLLHYCADLRRIRLAQHSCRLKRTRRLLHQILRQTCCRSASIYIYIYI